MDKKATSHAKIERWTARRKADLVLELIKGQKTIVDAAREYDLKQSEVQSWIDRFMEYGRQALRANPKKVESVYEEDPEDQKMKIIAETVKLSRLLGMIPSDSTIDVQEPLTHNTMALSEWFNLTRDSFLKLSLLISKALGIQLQ